jgi:Ca2+-binding RTX toxin-like protein
MAIINGTSINDTLFGSWGNDIIDGSLGADSMYGGGGNDIYYVDDIGDVINETAISNNNTAVELVSVAAGGTLGNGHSNSQTISQDGNLVGFYSNADNLFAGDTNLHHEFDIKNMTTGVVIPVKYAPAGFGGGPVSDYGEFNLTPDGHYAVFASSSVGLMPGIDDTTDEDIFVVNLFTGDISIESQPTGSGVSVGHSGKPDISDDGRYVVFTSPANLVYGTDANGAGDTDVYWRDRVTGETRMVSGSFDGTFQGDSDSTNASVTNDGRYVLFESAARNFGVAGAPGIGTDLFLRDMVNNTIELITAPTPTITANGPSSNAQITPDGHYIVFNSRADNLITGDTNGGYNIFRKDLTTGVVVKVNTTATGAQDNSIASHAQITPDGRYVVFEGHSTNLVPVASPGYAILNIFVKDLVTGQIEIVSRTETGQFALTDYSYAPQISSDGSFISFYTRNTLLSSDSNGFEDVYRVPNPFYSATDEVRSSVSYTLPTNVENLVLIGTAAINGGGNALNNQLTGNSADNVLSGGSGIDTMTGGLGNDSYSVSDTGDVVIENVNEGTDTVSSRAATYTLAANVENLILTGVAAINGGGNALNNQMTGNSADNVLSGGSGIDTMTGGLGNDSYSVSDTTDVVIENLNEGTDTVSSRAANYTLAANVENLILTGTAAINGTGNALNNQLTGNSANNVLSGDAGNDTISGGSGIDTMTGGLGDDSYSVSDTGDVVVENLNEGTDTVSSRAANYTLAANVENLILTGTAAINGSGNALNNQLTGNSADNVLSGGSGIDTMTGGLGNDSYSVSDANDVVIENLNEGIDTVSSRATTYTLAANVENLILTGTAAINGGGNALNNQLTGNSADNVLRGGMGEDILVGGLGKDTYNLAEATAATDTLSIATGDSLVSSYDIANAFKLGTGTINTIGVDRLDLASTVIATNVSAINGTDSGTILSHSINNGIISFDDINTYTSPLTITAANLADTLGYLQTNITANNTVAFISEGNTFVFQDGGVTDTLVELVGVVASSINTSGLATNAVWIV